MTTFAAPTQATSVTLPRSLDPLERLFWLLDRRHPSHFTLAARILGAGPGTKWRDALDALQARHPLLCAAIDGPDEAPRFVSCDGEIPLRIESDPHVRVEHEIGREFVKPFDPARGPLLRAVVLQHGNDATLILVAHHAIADGMSLAFLIRDLLYTLADKTVPDAPPGLPPPSIVAGDEADLPDYTRPATLRVVNDAQPSVELLTLDASFVDRLRRSARSGATTVNALLCAAGAISGAARCAEWSNAPVRLSAPVNVRSVRNGGEECGLFIGLGAVRLDVGPQADLFALARYAQGKLRAMHGPEGLAATQAQLEQIVASDPDVEIAGELLATLLPFELHLTNLGCVPYGGRIGAFQIEALYGPSMMLGLEGEQHVGVGTIDGALSLTHTSFRPIVGLLAGMRDVLERFC